MLLGARQITSPDLGFHLAFGEKFYETGKIVDHTPFIYTLPPLDTPESNRPEPGPGNWYDNEGRYRFPNANWLSQLFMYGSWSLMGPIGINILQIFLITGCFVLLTSVMRRNKVPVPLISLSLLVMGLTVNFRLNMRPELFGYLCLIFQYMMLTRLETQQDKPLPPSWSWVGGMIFVQLLFVNFHSYFLLGLAIIGAMLGEYCIYAIKKRFIDKEISQIEAYKNIIKRLSITLIGMLLVCFMNPWGWRLALLPFQTLLFMERRTIGGQQQFINPWIFIQELKETINEWWLTRPSDYAILIILVLAAAALILQLAILLKSLYQNFSTRGSVASNKDTFRVRWGYLFMIVGMVFVGLKVRRNISIASLVIVPSALICITESLHYFLSEKKAYHHLKFLSLANISVLALSLFGVSQIINGKLFEAEYLPSRFGFGISNTQLPIGASVWLNRHAPEARVWCDFDTSSSIHFFTRPHRDVPILTNAWAYPPVIMLSNAPNRLEIGPFNFFVNNYKVDAVIAGFSANNSFFHRYLAKNPDWQMVHVEGKNVLYLNSDNKYKALAAKYGIRPGNFDASSFVSQQLLKDPSFERTILSVADIFKNIDELDLAISVIEEGVKKNHSPGLRAWVQLYNLYGNRFNLRRQSGDARFTSDIKQMKQVLEKILNLEPENVDFSNRLKALNQIFPE